MILKILATEEHGKIIIMESLINSMIVIPAQAGIQGFNDMDAGLRRRDDTITGCKI